MNADSTFKFIVAWVFCSLLAIGFIQTRPYLGLSIAVVGGLIVGAIGVASYRLSDADGRATTSISTFVAKNQWLILSILGPLFLFPGSWRTLALLLLPLLWGLRWVTCGSPTPSTPVNGSILLMLVMVLVSEWATYDLAQSLPKIAGLLWGIASFYAVSDAMVDRSSWERGIAALLLLGLGVAGLGLLGTDWPTKIPVLAPMTTRLPLLLKGLPGAASGFNPNEVGGALTWTIPVALAASLAGWRSHRHRWTIAAGGAALFMFIVVLLSQSRGSLLGLGIGTLGALVLAGGRRLRLALGTAALIGLLAILWVGPQRIGEYVLDRPGALDLAHGVSLTGRLEVWSRAVYAIGDFSFTGMGMNTFRTVMPVIYPISWISPDRDIGHAHNELLQAALDLGIPGLVAFVSIYAVAGIVLIQRNRLAESDFQRVALAGFGAGLTGHFVYSLTDAITLGAKPGIIFWLLLALAVSRHRTKSSVCIGKKA